MASCPLAFQGFAPWLIFCAGAPRVGNVAWAGTYNATVPETWCLVNYNVRQAFWLPL